MNFHMLGTLLAFQAIRLLLILNAHAVKVHDVSESCKLLMRLESNCLQNVKKIKHLNMKMKFQIDHFKNLQVTTLKTFK